MTNTPPPSVPSDSAEPVPPISTQLLTTPRERIAARFCQTARRFRPVGSSDVPAWEPSPVLKPDGSIDPQVIPGLRTWPLHPDQPGVLLLADYLISRRTVSLTSETIAHLDLHHKTDKKSVGKTCALLASEVGRVAQFLQGIIHLPGESVARNDVQQTRSVADLRNHTACNDHHLPTYDYDPIFWIFNSCDVSLYGIKFLRNWIDTHSEYGQIESFYRRYWNPISAYKERVASWRSSEANICAEANEWVSRLREAQEWIHLYSLSLLFQKGTLVSADIPQTADGVPERFRIPVDILKQSGMRMTAKQFFVKAKYYLSHWTNKDRCSAADLQWAKLHLIQTKDDYELRL